MIYEKQRGFPVSGQKNSPPESRITVSVSRLSMRTDAFRKSLKERRDTVSLSL